MICGMIFLVWWIIIVFLIIIFKCLILLVLCNVVLFIVILLINIGFNLVIGVIVLVWFIWNLILLSKVSFFCVGNL